MVVKSAFTAEHVGAPWIWWLHVRLWTAVVAVWACSSGWYLAAPRMCMADQTTHVLLAGGFGALVAAAVATISIYIYEAWYRIGGM